MQLFVRSKIPKLKVGVSHPGGCVHTLTGHQSLTSGMELRDNILVSGNADSTVRVWDIRTGQCLHTLQGERGRERERRRREGEREKGEGGRERE